MTTTTMEIARERQLDWLLDEVFAGAVRSGAVRSGAAPAMRWSRPWLAAALIVLGAGVAFGVAALRETNGTGSGHGVPTPVDAPQDSEAAIPWLECHGEAKLDAVPDDVTALRCFDFTDAGLARLQRLSRLQYLDLSGMDVDGRGVSRPPNITDAGVAQLAKLTALRWLSLASCHQVNGESLAALRAIPQLEHLDLTYTVVTSAGIAQLPQLPSLRELTLSHCLTFHGRSLADVARLPGLRRLELAGCATIAADDVKQLAALHELRHLDLRDCMGAFRGQTMMAFDDVTNAPTDDPKQDNIGVTDAAVAALVELPLETLRLDDCRALTDALSASLQKMPRLRNVGLGNLPKITTAVVSALPMELRELYLDGNRHFVGAMFSEVERLSVLEVLSLNGVDQLSDGWLLNITRGKPLRRLHLGGTRRMGDAAGPDGAFRAKLSPATVAKVLAGLPTLEHFEATYSDWFTAEVAAAAAQLPKLTSIDLQAATLTRTAFAALGASRSLHELRLIWAHGVDVAALDELGAVPLQDLDLYGASDLRLKDMGLFESWPGVRVRLPEGTRYVEPARPGR